MANKHTHSVFSDQLMGQPLAAHFTNRLRPDQHLVGNGFLIGMAIRLPLGEDIPDRNQHPFCDGNDSFVAVHLFLQVIELPFTGGIATHCSLEI